MKNTKISKVVLITLLILIMINLVPTKSHAHRAYFLQVLIDEGQKLYVSNVIKESSLKESKKTEAQLWKYDFSTSTNYKNYDSTTNGKSSMAFTFPSKPHKTLGVFNSQNNATSKDATRAYKIADTLVPNLNELLIIMNEGRTYDTVEDLLEKSEELVELMSSGGSREYAGTTISFPSGSNSALVEGNGKSYEYLIRMKKGYKDEYLEDGKTKSPLYNSEFSFDDDIDYISIADIIVQANYTHQIKGHSAADMGEYSKPGTLEIKASEFFSSVIYSLQSILGLKDISELVYNQGIVGSNMYYGGIMRSTWMDSAVKFHMLFQALTWVALAIAIVKLLLQKNIATISSYARVSLIDGIKDLIVAGFMLISVFLLINLMITMNKRIVSIFATTIPDYTAWTGGDVDIGNFAGVLMRLYYLVITIYLNVIYTIRAISTSLLIASSPLFIASIAFQGKDKRIFLTWTRELTANVFMQSFQAFVLSFLLSAQMSSVTGIELAVVSFALIPMNNFFRSLVTGNSGGAIDNLGVAGVGMAGTAAGGLAKGVSSGVKGGANKASNFLGSFNDMPNKNSDSINVNRNPSATETQNTLSKQEVTFGNVGTEQMDENRQKLEASTETQATTDSNTSIEENPYTTVSNRPFKSTGDLSKDDVVQYAKSGVSAGFNIASGLAKATTGTAVGLALGGAGGAGGKLAGDMIGSGFSDIKQGTTKAAMTAGDFVKKGANSLHRYSAEKYPNNVSSGGNILGAEELQNGNVSIHRDRKMLENEGLADIKKTEAKDIAVTYNKENMSDENKEYLAKIEGYYKDNKMEQLNELGISNINMTEDGNTVVHYNDYGQNQLGFKDVYRNNNRVVETKLPGQNLESKLIYDIEGISPTAKMANDSNESYTAYNGPSDGGTSFYE